MDILAALVLIALGLALILAFAARLVEGVVGASLGFGVSAFLISVVFIGFDPENLAVGAVGAYEEESAIALGSIVGAAMVAIGLAFGITALLSPMRFERAALRIVAMGPLAILLLWGLVADGDLERPDGALLLGAYAVAVVYLAWLSRRGVDIKAGGEVAEALKERERDAERNRWQDAGWMLLSLAAIVVGSEVLVSGAKDLVDEVDIDETAFGITLIALLVSIEELARELPAARAGHAEIAYGNVIGSILVFFLLNAGIIALVRPVEVADEAIGFYLPMVFATSLVVSFFLALRQVPRGAGGLLVALYAAFFVVGYL